MKREMAKAAADELENDKRVEKAEVSKNEKGVLVVAHAIDRVAARNLKGDLGKYPVYVKVEVHAQEES